MIDEKRKKGYRLCEITMDSYVRPLNVFLLIFIFNEQLNDFKRAMTRVQATGKAAYSYSRSSQESAFIDALLSHGENIQSSRRSSVSEVE